jgi:hypothetical protein
MSTSRKAAGVVGGLLVLLVVFAGGYLAGRTGAGSVVDPASLPDAERQFIERMSGASLVGRFTIAGRDDRPARPERYDLSSVEKSARTCGDSMRACDTATSTPPCRLSSRCGSPATRR